MEFRRHVGTRIFAGVAAAAVVASVVGGCSGNSDEGERGGSPGAVTVTKSESSSVSLSPDKQQGPGPSAGDRSITRPATPWRDALAIAQKDFSGAPKSIKLALHHGTLRYEIALVSDTEEAELDIDDASRKITARDLDRLDGDDVAAAKRDVISLDGVIEPDRAVATATGTVSGTVTDWELQRERGRLIYEVGVDVSGGDLDVIVDAKTGQVIGRDR